MGVFVTLVDCAAGVMRLLACAADDLIYAGTTDEQQGSQMC